MPSHVLAAVVIEAIGIMAEPAHTEVGAAVPAPGIKQEHEPTGLEGLDFNLSPEFASKRPYEDMGGGANESPEAKRSRTENQAEEDSLEDGLALLVQNALSNVGDLVDQFNGTPDVPATTPEPMEVDSSTAPETAPEPAREPATFFAEPQQYIRDVNIHALGNLVRHASSVSLGWLLTGPPLQALSLLLILVQLPLDETMKLIKNGESGHGRAYRQLKQSLEQVRLLYTSKPVLSSDELGVHEDESRTMLDLANLAQLGLWLVDGTPSSLNDADENFLSMFNCQVSDLPDGMTELYLGIMTQRAVETLVKKESEKPPEEVLGEVLMSGLEDRLRGQHGGDKLTSADQSFVSSVQSRKQTLQGEAKAQAEPSVLTRPCTHSSKANRFLAGLREKHPLEELLRIFVAYVKGRLNSASELGNKFDVPIQLSDESTPVEPEVDEGGDGDLDLDDLSSFFEKTASGLVQNALAGLIEESAADPTLEGGEPSAEHTNGETKTDDAPAQTNGKIDLMTDYKELEALVDESTSNYVKTTLHGLSPVPYQPTVPQSTTESMAAQLPYLHQLQQHQAQHPYYTTYAQPAPEPQAQPPAPGENLPPNQTFPSAILYDKARQAALSKSSAHTRREGLHSTRRPWTQEEEKALMAGLDMVKGPHWSQILTYFGQNGTISDILKDRTQVQLKDKARNLKLFFLKTNSEMPFYLQAVTGELKTRAPTQAARKEAEERARMNSEEDQAKLQGIMALAGGLQHPPQQGKGSGSPAAGMGTGVVTPAQAASAAQAASSTQHSTVASQGNVSTQHTAPATMQRTMGTPTAQAARPGAQATTQQVLQAMPQAPPRPQAQLPPRSQTQQHGQSQAQGHQQHHYQPQPQQPQQQQQQQQQQSPLVRSPATAPGPQGRAPESLAQQAQHAPSWPLSMPTAQQPRAASTVATTTNTTTPTQPQPQPQPQTQAQPQPHQLHDSPPAPAHPSQSPHSHPSSSAATPGQSALATPAVEAPRPQGETQHDDNAAEAALLEGLQAAVAQSLS
ncbi:Telomeric DNA-binding factor trf1 [Tolypocladium ophioglossoides CBS 100239]|uniref:Telomeric DNA-binding factor trf1 n=1 Tax=Tolypocladium ophioglossoides (strain CBS 100239) TaxID=1163406 RepID=A0A0L0NJU4_TOLOC|nr:Telomeric DNA-binding factor trf1 [Tolypocladium ophioglossoides CBS 100239]